MVAEPGLVKSLEPIASATLFAQAGAVIVVRLLALVYATARTAYAPDRARLGVAVLAGWVVLTLVIAGVLIVAGVWMRRGGAVTRTPAAVIACVALSSLLNIAVLVRSAIGIAGRPGAQGTVTWLVLASAASVVLLGVGSAIASRRSSRAP